MKGADHIELAVRQCPVPVDFAIHAMEVAALIRAHVDPYRQAARARGNDRVDVPVIQKVAWRAEDGLRAGLSPRR